MFNLNKGTKWFVDYCSLSVDNKASLQTYLFQKEM